MLNMSLKLSGVAINVVEIEKYYTKMINVVENLKRLGYSLTRAPLYVNCWRVDALAFRS